MSVTDDSRKFDKAIDAFLDAKGSVDCGVMSNARYPKERGGTLVAVVAAVWQARNGWMSRAVDSNEADLKREFELMRDQLIRGKNPEASKTRIGRFTRDKMRSEVRAAGLFKEGILHDNIKFRVDS